MSTRAYEIIRNLNAKPRFHGNGFVQLYIGERKRLHIWTPELPAIRSHNARIHDHRYDMESEILYGCLQHTTFDTWVKINGGYEIIQLDGASEVRHKPGHILTEEFAWQIRHRYSFFKGSSYNFKQHLFHDSASDIFTVTVMTKSPENSNDFARIIVPKGTPQPTHAFAPEYQPSQSQLWKIISQACHHCGVAIMRHM